MKLHYVGEPDSTLQRRWHAFLACRPLLGRCLLPGVLLFVALAIIAAVAMARIGRAGVRLGHWLGFDPLGY